MVRKKLFITAIAIFSFIVFLSIFVILWFWGDRYPDFSNKDFTASAEIPGLEDGFVPQGIANYTHTTGNDGIVKQEYLFVSSYRDGSPSRLYVTGTRTGYIGFVTLKNEDGTDYTGHAGGVATSCNNSDANGNKVPVKNGTLWVVSDGTVYCAKASSSEYYNIAEEVIKKAALTDGENVIQFTASFKANNKASFCFFYEDGKVNISDDKLYVGEFYRPGDDRYSTAENHHVTTLDGAEQYAFVTEYSSNTTTNNAYGVTLLTDSYVKGEDGELVKKDVPKVDKVISIPDKIQGFAITKSKQLVLSQSYGLPNSHLYYYNWNTITETTAANRASFSSLTGNNFEYEEVYKKSGAKYSTESMYVYFADESRAIRDYSVPSMAEGLCVNDDRIYVLFESGCYKYKPFVRQRIYDVYVFTPREK